jgi:outer membrane protein TolC
MRKTILLLLSLGAGSTAMASDALPDPAAVAEALDRHPTVVAARARVGAAEAEARVHSTGPHEVTLTTSVTRRSVDFDGQYVEYDALLTRPIRLPGKGALDRDIGRHGLDAASNRAEDAKHQAALLLADAWWDWVSASAEARVDQVIVDNHVRLVAAVKRRESLGDASRLEVDQAEAALATARIGLEHSQGRARRARVRLETQFPDLPLPAEAPEAPIPAAPEAGWDAYQQMIVANNHEIGAARAEAARSSSLAAKARRDRTADPSIGVRVFSERGGMEKGGGLVLSIPFGGGHRSALADRAAAEASAAAADVRAVEANVAEVAATDIADAEYRLAAWQRARDALGSQMAALTKLRRGYELGEVDLVDLLAAERLVGEAFRAEALITVEAYRAVTRVRIDSHELWLGD